MRDAGPEPWWAGAVPDLVKVTAAVPGFAAGWRFTSPVVDMATTCRGWRRLADRGVAVEVAAVTDLADATDPGGVVVDCAGLRLASWRPTRR